MDDILPIFKELTLDTKWLKALLQDFVVILGLLHFNMPILSVMTHSWKGIKVLCTDV